MSLTVNRALRMLIRKTIPTQVVPGTVAEVDENKFVIDVDPVDDGARYNDVRLRSVIDDKDYGVIVIPEKGANVLIGIIHNNDNAPYLISADKIRKLIIKTKSCQMMFEADGTIKFNDGKNGGLAITPTLISELNKTNAVVNAIKNLLLTWLPVSQDGGAALKAAAAATLPPLSVGDFSNIENKKVKH